MLNSGVVDEAHKDNDRKQNGIDHDDGERKVRSEVADCTAKELQDQIWSSFGSRPDHRNATERIPGVALVRCRLAGRDRDRIAILGEGKWLEIRRYQTGAQSPPGKA